MITTCPHCATRVIPTRDGQCPACRRKLAADALSDSQFEAVDQVWQQVGAESASSTAAAAAPMDDPTASLSLKSTDQEQSSAPRQRQAAYVWVTPLIIGLNLLVFVALLVAARSVLPPPDLVLAWGANFGPKTLAGQWWRLFTSIFLHFGILHVALNMWVLWDTGRLVERMVGNIGFGVLYFLSGLAGSLASLAWDPSVNSAGASGAVFGVCGALLGFLARRPSAVPPAVLKSLRSSMLAFVGYNLFFGFVIWGMNRAVRGGIGIDNAAHLGGLAAGFGCGLVLGGAESPTFPEGRLVRSALLLLVGLPGAAGIWYALPAPPPDVEAEFTRFAEAERGLLRRYDELANQSRQGALTDAEFADALDVEVLAPWREWRLKMTRLGSAPRANPAFFHEVGRGLSLREQSWEALVASVRNNDPAKLEEHRQKWDAAEEATREFQSRHR